MDILRTTGCRWSKIIYPGFKGYLKPQDKDQMYKSPIVDPKMEGFLSASLGDAANLTNFMDSFNQEYSKIVEANQSLRKGNVSRGKS